MKKFNLDFPEINQEPNSVYINGVLVATKDDWDKLMNNTCLELYNLKVKFNKIIDLVKNADEVGLNLLPYSELKKILEMKKNEN